LFNSICLFVYSIECYDRNANLGHDVVTDAFDMILPNEAT